MENGSFAPDRPEDYVGDPAQREMQRRAYQLWRSVSADPRYAYEGRLVALNGVRPDTIEDMLFLVREQCAAVTWYVNPDDEGALSETLTAMGYAVDRWDQHLGADEAVRAAEKLCGETFLPDGYDIREIDADTPDAIIEELARVGAEQGVMVPAAHVMRGATRPSVIMYATAPNGCIVAIAGSVLAHHRDNALAASAWWGMLCTHPDHRGKSLSKILGARTMLAMAARHGATSFYTGIRRENAVSQAVCTRLGVRRTAYAVLMAVNVEASGGKSLTR
ncbi:MAG: GNAT family N-acetyltransferase [Xanthobacteraceae bacterium]